MPFEYQPFVNPYVSSMSDLMGRGVEARSRAELSAAEAEAGGKLRLGDLTQQKWSGLGNTIGQGIDAYVTEQREAPIREEEARLRGLNITAAETQAERAGVTAAREDEQYLLDQEGLKYGDTFDTIMSGAELEFGADPENREALRVAVRERIAQAGLPASYLNDYDELVRVADAHESALLRDKAQIEAANARGASDKTIREQAEKRQEYFQAIRSTRDEFGYNSPGNRAARRDYFLFVGEEDPVLKREHDLSVAKIQASSRSTNPQIASAIDNYTGAIRDFAQTGNRAPMHQAEQLLWSLGQNPGNVRANIVEGIHQEQTSAYMGLNPVHLGVRPGTPPESLFPSLPAVSTMGSVYAPPPPLEPRSVEGAITESELAVEVEKYDLGSLDEAAVAYRDRGIDVVEDDGSPSWLGLNKPPPRTTDIPLPASSISERPIAAPDVSEPGTQWGRQRRRLTEWGQRAGDVTRAAAETGAAIARTPLLADRPLARSPRPRAR